MQTFNFKLYELAVETVISGLLSAFLQSPAYNFYALSDDTEFLHLIFVLM